MVTGGGVARGYLRPGFARSPPLLLIALILITGISVFNYWNLSAQYSDVVKEISELQDHIRIVTNKHETAEKLVETLHKNLRNSEDQVGKLKVNLSEKNFKLNEVEKRLNVKNEEVRRLGQDLKDVENANHQRNKDQLEQRNFLYEMDTVKDENKILKQKNDELRHNLELLKAQIAYGMHPQYKPPNIMRYDHAKTEDAETSIIQPYNKEVNETEDEELREIETITDKVDEEREGENVTSGPTIVPLPKMAKEPNFEYSIMAGDTGPSVVDVKLIKNPIVNLLKNQISKGNGTRALTSSTPETITVQKSKLLAA